MDEIGPTAYIIFIFFVLIVDFLFYGFGEALRGVNRKEVDQKAEKGDKKSIRINKILDRPVIFVNTLQFVVLMLNFLVGYYFTHNLWQLGIMFYIMLSFAILMPKKLAARNADKWSYKLVNLIYGLTILFWPFTWLVANSVKAVLWCFGIRKDVNLDDVTEEEILSMVNEGHEQGVLEESEAMMINNIFEYGDKEAQDIMTHRNNIVGIDGDMPVSEVLQFMLDERMSRYPVYEENIDHIIGILHLKDVLRASLGKDFIDGPVKEVSGIMRDVVYIPMTRNIDELFKQMQSEKIQMVIVVDEYGQTGGLVAMEDILEEIVGNIQDEYDEDIEYIEEKGQDEYIIEGITPLEELEEKLGISFEDEEFETINGFLISRLEHIPEVGEDFDTDYSGYNFKVLSVENFMIQSVLVTKIPEESVVSEELTLDENI